MNEVLEQYRKVYRLLADEQSREIYLDYLNFLISYRSDYMNRIFQYSPSPAIMRYTFADLLNDMPSDEPIVLYGAGEFPQRCFDEWRRDERIIGFCADNSRKQQEGFLGYPVMKPEDLFQRRNVNVMISTTAARDEILNILLENKFPKERIFTFPDIEPGWMDPNQYFPEDIIKFDKETFIDAGCCDLGTSLQLRKRCNEVKKVYAFEPDPINYELCMNKIAETDYTQVNLFPFGTWSKKTKLEFRSTGNGTSHIASSMPEEGGEPSIRVPVISIDEVVDKEDHITFIKMDVEGAELESLKGAKETILRDHPKLAICIYHKPEDLLEIPLYITSIVPEYKLYIRHYGNDECELVLYAVMP